MELELLSLKEYNLGSKIETSIDEIRSRLETKGVKILQALSTRHLEKQTVLFTRWPRPWRPDQRASIPNPLHFNELVVGLMDFLHPVTKDRPSCMVATQEDKQTRS